MDILDKPFEAYMVPSDEYRPSKEFFPGTYELFKCPPIGDMYGFCGDYSWACGLESPVMVKSNSLETFIENPQLHKLIESPTACYTYIEKENGKTWFYCDQQGCIQWYVNHDDNDHVYSSIGNLVANDIEEFLFRYYLDSFVACYPEFLPPIPKRIENLVDEYKKRLLELVDEQHSQ